MFSVNAQSASKFMLRLGLVLAVTFFYQTAWAMRLPVLADFEFEAAHRASPLYVWQNDPETLAHFEIPLRGVTQLCLTSALGTALLNEYAYRKPISKKAELDGVDTHQLQLRLVGECEASPTDGTNFLALAKCSLNYFERVHLIRKTLYAESDEKTSLDQRLPSPEDIEAALARQNQVIASIAYAAPDPETHQFKEVSSHAVNVFGFERISNGLIKLWITNPTRNYQADGAKVVFDEVYLNYRSPTEVSLSDDLAPWEWSGRLIPRPGRRAFLVGLTVLTPMSNFTLDSL